MKKYLFLIAAALVTGFTASCDSDPSDSSTSAGGTKVEKLAGAWVVDVFTCDEQGDVANIDNWNWEDQGAFGSDLMKIPIRELDFLSQLEPFCTVYGAGKRTHCILVSGVGRISCKPHRIGNGIQSISAAEYKILCKTIQKWIGFDQKPLKRTGAVIW